MTHTSTHFFLRLFAGYRALLRGSFRLLAATVLLLLVSAGISLPIWFLAHTAPTAFDVLVLTIVGIAAVWSIVRRARSGTDSWSLRRFMVSTSVLAGPVFVLFLALLSHSAILAGAGVLFLSGVIAWRVVPS